MANPGIRSIETSGTTSRAGAVTLERAASPERVRRANLSDVAAGRGVDVPHADAYAWRLYVSRRLYDRGVAMQGSPALAALVAVTTLRLNHLDLDRLGVADGGEVLVSGPRGRGAPVGDAR